MLELLTYILENIVSKEDFEVNTEVVEDRTIFKVSVIKDKVGIVIGKGGKTIKAIQDILYTASKLKGEKVFVDVIEK